MKLLIRKIISFIIDYIITGGLVSIFYFCANVFFLEESTRSQGELMLICALVSILFLPVYIPLKNNGQTLGEKIMKIKIINNNGKDRTWIQCFIRETVIKFTCGIFFAVFTILYFIVNNLIIHRDVNEELPHDFLLKTQVIEE